MHFRDAKVLFSVRDLLKPTCPWSGTSNCRWRRADCNCPSRKTDPWFQALNSCEILYSGPAKEQTACIYSFPELTCTSQGFCKLDSPDYKRLRLAIKLLPCAISSAQGYPSKMKNHITQPSGFFHACATACLDLPAGRDRDRSLSFTPVNSLFQFSSGIKTVRYTVWKD